ncbi:MAG: hypothetical protein J7L34_01335 [Thermotogaceae bacterium]|nr:hypothetical protein [Thermotogaceae bacterium]
MRKFILIPIIFIALHGFSLGALQSPHAVLLYEDGLTAQASFVATAYETYRDNVIDLIGNDPGNVTIILKNSGAITNGMAETITNSITVLPWAQPDPFLNFNSWYETVTVHEFSHISHLNYSGGINAFFKLLFGVPVFDSQFRSPFVEAAPVYSESSLPGDSGRLNNPVIDSAVISYIKGQNPSLARISSPAEEDFMGYSMYYFIPSRFYSFLNDRFSNDKVKDFLKSFSDNFMGLCITCDFKEAFGSSPDALFEKWKEEFTNRTFSRGDHIIAEENAFINKLDVQKGSIYYTKILYGKEQLYGWNGYKLYKLENSKRIFIKNLSSVVDFKVVGDYLYILEGYVYKSTMPFSYFKRRIVRVDLTTGKEKIVADGLISSFDVDGKNVVYSVYDPFSEKSVIYTEKDAIVVKGFAREIAAGGNKMAVLLEDRYFSSKILIFENDKKIFEINDALFKYSIGWTENMLYFVGLDKESADVYSFENGKFYRLTKGFAFYNAKVINGTVYAAIFSQDFTGTEIIKARVKKVPYMPEKPQVHTLKEVKVKEIDAYSYYLKKTLYPILHVPVALKDKTDWEAGVLLGGASPDLSLIWTVAPVLSQSLKPDIYGVFILNLSNFSAYAYKLPWESGVQSSLILKRVRFSTSSGASWGISGSFDAEGRYSFSTFWNQYVSSLAFGTNAGWGDKGFSGNLQLKFYEGDFIIKATAGFYGGFYGSAGLAFPLWFGDAGLFDPLFNVSHIFGEVDLGYDGGIYLKAMVGSEIAEFVTYSRSFPKVGIIWNKNGIGIDFGMGF